MYVTISIKKKRLLLLLKNVKFAFVQEKRTDKNFLCDVTRQDQLESFFF